MAAMFFSTSSPQRYRRRTPWPVVAVAVAAGACQPAGGKPVEITAPPTPVAEAPAAPTPAPPPPKLPKRHMIVAGHPLAAKAGRYILRAGGSAIDAAIAAQMVLTLVEPQSSGIGGGAFLLHYAADTGAIDSYDGRETAPQSASPRMFLKADGEPKKFYDAVVGGSSVGVPGVVRMLEMAHRDHGKLPWKDLFAQAIDLARKGVPVSNRLAKQLEKEKYLKLGPAGAYFYANDGTPKPAGAILKNPDLAETLEAISENGAKAFYEGDIANAIVGAVSRAAKNKSGMTAADIAAYAAKKRPPVCLPYRAWLVCGMGPPSSGGITSLQILGLVQRFDLAGLGAYSAKSVHVIAEAGRLAFADRNVYIADPEFVPVPTAGLLDPGYLELRAAEISPFKSRGKQLPGMPGVSANLNLAPDDMEKGLSTAHLSVIDADGNAVSMTSSVESAFGSRLMVRGFILNNQLTDFSFRPQRDGAPVANRAEPGKRPRSSMAPTLVFDDTGRVIMAIGSPGGSRIIGYVARTVIAALDWKESMDTAVNGPNFTNRNGATDLEKGTALEVLKPELESMGHEVKVRTLGSGLNGFRVTADGFDGGADRRREGVALGD